MSERKVNYKQLGMMGLVVLVAFISVLYDYVSVGFDASMFASPAYWVQMITLNAATVLILLSMRGYSKDREFNANEHIARVSGEIDVAYIKLNQLNLNTEFENYVKSVNRERKLKCYTDKLKSALSKARRENRKQKITEKLRTAESDVEFTHVRYPKVSVSTIFSKTKLKQSDDLILDYQEGRAIGDLLINKVAGLVGFGLFGMSFAGSALKAFDASLLLASAIKLFQIGLAVYVGMTAGRDFVKGTMLAKLKLRLSFVQQFLERRKSAAQPVKAQLYAEITNESVKPEA